VADHQHPNLDWRDGVPVATRFDDPYFSLENGWAETNHVFLAGNDLPGRFRPGFHIAELGFGTGLNALVAWDAWTKSKQSGDLRFTSFERFPLPVSDMERALSVYPDLVLMARPLLDAFDRGDMHVTCDGLNLTVIIGDARQTLPGWADKADAWFLDGFAPAKNPELWEPGLLAQVASHTGPGGTAATYSAAGAVRSSLADAGFVVDRIPGFGRKRHMTVARLP